MLGPGGIGAQARTTLAIPFLAAYASAHAMLAGTPFGGSMGWLMVVVMSNDSGQAPYAPLATALLGFPVTLTLDITLLPVRLLLAALKCLFAGKRGQQPVDA